MFPNVYPPNAETLLSSTSFFRLLYLTDPNETASPKKGDHTVYVVFVDEVFSIMNPDTLNSQESDCGSWMTPGATEVLGGWFSEVGLPYHSNLLICLFLPHIRPLHMTPATSAPTPRRLLMDEDRRRICPVP